MNQVEFIKDARWGLTYEAEDDPTEYYATKQLLKKRIAYLLEEEIIDETQMFYFRVSLKKVVRKK